MTYTYSPPKTVRKRPLKAALRTEELSASADGKWHTDGFVCVRAPVPEGLTAIRGNRNGNVEKLVRKTIRAANKSYRPARVLAEFTFPAESARRVGVSGSLLVLEAHYHTGPIIVACARFDYIMALWPEAIALTERRSTFVAFRQGKQIVGFLAEVTYAEPGDLATAMHEALKEGGS